jgi:hypothetical protein
MDPQSRDAAERRRGDERIAKEWSVSWPEIEFVIMPGEAKI